MTGGARAAARRVAVLILALAAGAAAGVAFIPIAFSRVPTDLSRTVVLLRALATEPPVLAVFGNSVAMCGVDARVLGRELRDGARAYNLSSTGQTLAESFLYYQELGETTRILVYVLSPGQVETPVAFNEHVPNVFRMAGFEPQPDTLRTLEGAFPSADIQPLRAPEVTQRFEARWVLRQAIDTVLRQRLRPDLDLARVTTDLEFPTPYTKRVADAVLDEQLRVILLGRGPGPLRPFAGQARLLSEIAERARHDGRRVVFVLAPLNPRLLSGLGPQFVASVRSWFGEFEARDVGLVDALELLGEPDFIDSVHPTPAGAQRLTAVIAEAIRGG